MDKKDEVYRYYILFPNHNEGLRAHRALKEAGIKCTISPTPRKADHSCGISLMLEEKYALAAEAEIKLQGIETKGMVKLKKIKPGGYKGC